MFFTRIISCCLFYRCWHDCKDKHAEVVSYDQPYEYVVSGFLYIG